MLRCCRPPRWGEKAHPLPGAPREDKVYGSPTQDGNLIVGQEGARFWGKGRGIGAAATGVSAGAITRIRIYGLRPGVVDTKMRPAIRAPGGDDVRCLPGRILAGPETSAALVVWPATEDLTDRSGASLT